MLRRLAPLFIFTSLATILLWQVILGGKALLPGEMLYEFAPWKGYHSAGDVYWNALAWDSVAYFYPARKFLGDSLRLGRIPLWNPYQMCGVPFLADPQTAVLYPPNLLFAILPTHTAVGILAFLHVIAAGLFTYVFLRGLKVRRIAAVAGGIAFMLSGYTIVWLELPVFLRTGVWLPLTLHFSRIAHERRSARSAIMAGLTIALSLLGGHPQIAFYSLLASALFWIYLILSSRKEPGVAMRSGLMLLVLLVGFAFSAPQVLPTLELAALSHRAAKPTLEGYTEYNQTALRIPNLIVLVAPDFYGNPSKTGAHWGIGEYADMCGYVGILPLMLAPLAFVKQGRRWASLFFAVLAITAFLIATGTEINKVLYFVVPGFATSGTPTRVLFLYMFSVAVLAGIGLDSLLNRHGSEVRRPLLCSVATDLALLVLGIVLFKLNIDFVRQRFPGLDALETTLPLVWLSPSFFLAGFSLKVLALSRKLGERVCGALVVSVVAADLLVWGIPYNNFCEKSAVYPETKLVRVLHSYVSHGRIMPLNACWNLENFPNAVFPPNTAMVYGIPDVQGYSALYPMRYKKLIDAAAGRNSSPRENGNMMFAFNPDSPVWDLVGVEGVVSMKPLRARRLLCHAEGCYLYRNEGAIPRIFVVHKIETAEDSECICKIIEGKVDLAEVALVTPKEQGQLQIDTTADFDLQLTQAAVRVLKEEPNFLSVEVRSSRAGMLVVTNQYYPGWTAKVDGKPVDVLHADYAFQGVVVPAGRHTVELAFNPQSFRIGRNIALVTFAVLCLVCGYAIGKRKHHSE